MSDATLNLRVLGNHGQPTSYDVVARVESIGVRDGPRAAFDTVVPSTAAGGVDVRVDAGAYNVQLFLADGRILQKACDVGHGETAPLLFEETDVRHTGFSLQEASGTASLAAMLSAAVSGRREPRTAPATQRAQAAGGTVVSNKGAASRKSSPEKKHRNMIATGATKSERLGRAAAPNAGKRVSGAGSLRVGASRARQTKAQAEPHGAPPIRRVRRSAETTETNSLYVSEPGSLEGSASWAQLASGPGLWPEMRWTRVRADEATDDAAIWRLHADLAERPLGAGRVWGLVRTKKNVEIVSIPAPWRCAGSGASSPIDVLVDGTVGGRAGTTVAVHDKALDGLLSYLDRGRLASVRPMLEGLERAGVIERTIDKKRSNPLAACAAAYVGLAVLGSDAQARWDAWLPNIMNWFPRIADGAVVHARRILIRPKTADESGQLLSALERAFEAGVPYYSSGLLMMREMLELLEGDHARAGELLEQVAPVAARCDPRQMFTVLRYPEAKR
jgi:hypothetical protein